MTEYGPDLYARSVAPLVETAAQIDRGDATPASIQQGFRDALARALAEADRGTPGDPAAGDVLRYVADSLRPSFDALAALATQEAAQRGLVTVGADPALADANRSPAHNTPELPKNGAGERGEPRPDAADSSAR